MIVRRFVTRVLSAALILPTTVGIFLSFGSNESRSTIVGLGAYFAALDSLLILVFLLTFGARFKSDVDDPVHLLSRAARASWGLCALGALALVHSVALGSVAIGAGLASLIALKLAGRSVGPRS